MKQADIEICKSIHHLAGLPHWERFIDFLREASTEATSSMLTCKERDLPVIREEAKVLNSIVTMVDNAEDVIAKSIEISGNT